MKTSKIIIRKALALALMLLVSVMISYSQTTRELNEPVQDTINKELPEVGIDIGHPDYYLYLCNADNSDRIYACVITIPKTIKSEGKLQQNLFQEDTEEEIELEEWMVEPRSWLNKNTRDEKRLSRRY